MILQYHKAISATLMALSMGTGVANSVLDGTSLLKSIVLG